MALNCDIIGATLNYRAAAAKDWLSRSRQVSSHPSLKPANLDTGICPAVWRQACCIHHCHSQQQSGNEQLMGALTG